MLLNVPGPEAYGLMMHAALGVHILAPTEEWMKVGYASAIQVVRIARRRANKLYFLSSALWGGPSITP